MAHQADSSLNRKHLESEFAWLFESTFLTHLDVAAQELLLDLMCWKRYRPAEVLVHAGEQAKGFELIVEGEAQVVVANPSVGNSLIAKLSEPLTLKMLAPVIMALVSVYVPPAQASVPPFIVSEPVPNAKLLLATSVPPLRVVPPV